MKKTISLDIGFGHSHSAIKSGYEPYKIGSWIVNSEYQNCVNNLKPDIDFQKSLLKNKSI